MWKSSNRNRKPRIHKNILRILKQRIQFSREHIESEDQTKTIIQKGELTKEQLILPSEIVFDHPKYNIINDNYVSGIIIINYNHKNEINWIEPLLNMNINMEVSIFYEKQNTSEVIKELTYHIGNAGATLKTIGENQQDIDIISSVYDDAKYIRRELQLNQEELYHMCIYINTYAKNLEELEYNIEKIKTTCNSIGLNAKRANFRQEQLFMSTLPLAINHEDLKTSATRNILTSGLISTYPFISAELCDKEGIIIGHNEHNKSLVIIDRFNQKKYKNANMCILGTSGSGKSYLVKIMIIRNRYLNIDQMIIDPDREYENVCKSLNGTLFKLGPNSNTYVNIMDIRQSIIEDGEEQKGLLANKIAKLHIFFSIIFEDITPLEKAYLDEKIVKCYEQKEITFDDTSLYQKTDLNKIQIKPKFKTTEDMPILEDLYNLLKSDENTKKLATKLKPYINGSFKFFNNRTNVDINNKTVVADIHDLTDEQLSLGMYVIIDLFWDKIRENRTTKKIIYIDELWRLIGSTGNKKSAEYIFKIFKTIRKFNGGATGITQDVYDFFALENGKYGKAIINNSKFKTILQLEDEDIKLLKDILNLSDEEQMKIRTFERGEGIFYGDRNHIAIKVEASKKEHEIITKGGI